MNRKPANLDHTSFLKISYATNQISYMVNLFYSLYNRQKTCQHLSTNYTQLTNRLYTTVSIVLSDIINTYSQCYAHHTIRYHIIVTSCSFQYYIVISYSHNQISKYQISKLKYKYHFSHIPFNLLTNHTLTLY